MDEAPLLPSQVVSRRVREHRDVHRLTQAELVARLDERCGWRVDRSVIARIEAGDRIVSVDELFFLAMALDTSPTLLLTPADEAELMAPVGRRAMTSNRVRAWILDGVRLWEQDKDAALRSSEAAWARSAMHEKAMEQLADRLSAIHGVESAFDIEPAAKLPPKAEAEAQLLALRFVLAGQRESWELAVGLWPHTDIDAAMERLAEDPPAAMAAAKKLWRRRAVDEVTHRNEALAGQVADSYDSSRARADTMVGNLRDVVLELDRASRRKPARPKKPALPTEERARRPRDAGRA